MFNRRIRSLITLSILSSASYGANLSLEPFKNEPGPYVTPYHVFLCNTDTNQIRVTPIPRCDVTRSNQSDVIVRWMISDWWPEVKLLGTNKYVVTFEDHFNQVITLHHLEATSLKSGSLQNHWSKFLPTDKTVTFKYEIPKEYGDRYGVWSGQLSSRPFPIVNGVLILSSNDMALAMASAERSKNPVFGCIGDAKESVIRRAGEPNYWGQVKYTNTSAAVYHNDDYWCTFEFFTSTNGQTVLGEVSCRLSIVDESLKDGLIQKILQANSSGQEWVQLENSNKLSGKYKRDGAKASVGNNGLVIALDEYSALIDTMDKEKAKEQSKRLGKEATPNTDNGTQRKSPRAVLSITPPPAP